jgi:hypothetical protein
MKRGNLAPLKMRFTMAKVKITKRDRAIATMKSNADKPMAAVLQLIMAELEVHEVLAYKFYRYCVKENLAPGALTAFKGKAAPAAPKAPKAPKVTKVTKAGKGSYEKSVRAINAKVKAEKSVDDIAKIKEANLERMREVTAKLKPKGKVRDFGTRVARPEGEGVADFDPRLAREEVDAILRDERLIGVCPKFVSEDV